MSDVIVNTPPNTNDPVELTILYPKGDKGDMPAHQWTGTALSFEKPDGSFDTPVDLKGEKGDGTTPDQIDQIIAEVAALSVPIASKGVPDGVAPLDNTGKVPVSNLHAISINGVDFAAPGLNLFNPLDEDCKDDFYLNYNNGDTLPDTTTPNPIFAVSGYIPVKAGKYYTVAWKNGLAWFGAKNKSSWISGNPESDPNKTQLAPPGAKYMRTTLRKADKFTSYMIVEGDRLPAYEKFSYQLLTPEGINITAYVTANAVQSVNEAAGTKGLYLAYAPKMYAVPNRELIVYYENIIKYYDAYVGKCTIDYTPSGITGTPKRTDRGFKLKPTGNGTVSLNLSVGNGKFNRIVAFSQFSVIVSDISKTTPINILLIGDSYTQGAIFTRYLMSTAAKTGITYLGIKKAEQAPEWPTNGVKTQGFGGSTLAAQFVNNKTILMPWVHPGGSYLYYGNTSHWKEVLADVTTSPNWYWCKDYLPEVRALFSPTTGYKISPNTNDVMFDNALNGYVCWNGTAWTSKTEAELAFSFNFAKYRQAWGIAVPGAVHIMFAPNDWANVDDDQFAVQWPIFKANMDAMIASIKADTPTCKIVIALAVSSGRQGNLGDYTSESRKNALWNSASNIIKTYSGREAEGIYIVDYHSISDRVYGFTRIPEIPFEGFTGTHNETYVADTTHENADGYNQPGTAFAGIMQNLR